MLKIVHTPNKVLVSKAREVKNVDHEIERLVKEMQKTLAVQKDPEGVGLAAPQVGVDLAIFITRPAPDSQFGVFINPKIIKIQQTEELTRLRRRWGKPSQLKKQETKKKQPLEGCLSVPKIWSPIKRPNKVYLEYQDLTGKPQKKWFIGFEAVIIQHEVDHLQGVLFTQRALEQNLPLFEEREDKLEKVEI